MITIQRPLVVRLLDELSRTGEAVTRYRAQPGQDLLYPGHLPTGALFLLEGEVGRFGADGRVTRRLRPTGEGCPVPLVPLGELMAPSSERLTVLKRSELLHVGRTTCLPGGALQRCVRRLERALEPHPLSATSA